MAVFTASAPKRKKGKASDLIALARRTVGGRVIDAKTAATTTTEEG